jgi:hypothetical protein
MGFVLCTAACAGCGRFFPFNPNKVPSIIVDGVKEPVCKPCIDAANPKRVAAGLQPFVIQPDAYEPLPEEELI